MQMRKMQKLYLLIKIAIGWYQSLLLCLWNTS